MSSANKTTIPIFVVDTFADKPFHGNQSPVCVLPQDMVLDEKTMTTIAIELNMAEVTFIRTLTKDGNFQTADRVEQCWFNPEGEVKLCGHGAFAAAAVLFYHFRNNNKLVRCETKHNGELVLGQDGNAIRVDFPLGVTVRQAKTDHEGCIQSLGAAIPEVQNIVLCPALGYLLVRLKDGWSRQQFEEWRCDVELMKQAVSTTNVIVVIVTIAGNRERGYVDEEGTVYDFVSRVFVPPSKVRPEDPATGSTQTVLADYWSKQLGKNYLYTRQCSNRGGEATLEVDGNRVRLITHATIVIQGTLSF